MAPHSLVPFSGLAVALAPVQEQHLRSLTKSRPKASLPWEGLVCPVERSEDNLGIWLEEIVARNILPMS
jgi:hypothetical protein